MFKLWVLYIEIYINIYSESWLRRERRLELAMSQSNHQNVDLLCPSCPTADDCSSSWMRRVFLGSSVVWTMADPGSPECQILQQISMSVQFGVFFLSPYTHLPPCTDLTRRVVPMLYLHVSVHNSLLKYSSSLPTGFHSTPISVLFAHSEYFFSYFCMRERKLYFNSF